MSNETAINGVTASQSPTGFNLIQASDFYQKDSLLHPLAVGVIAIGVVFVYLRISSNRCVAPVTLFDWLINVALGSTLAGIVNGTSLTRGMISLCVLLGFQFISSHISSHYGLRLEHAINAPPLVIAFRGHALKKVMKKHRVSVSDLNGALRKAGVWNICQVECVIIEPTGDFAIFKRKDHPEGVEAEVLLDVPGYAALVKHFDQNSDEPKHMRHVQPSRDANEGSEKTANGDSNGGEEKSKTYRGKHEQSDAESFHSTTVRDHDGPDDGGQRESRGVSEKGKKASDEAKDQANDIASAAA